MKTALLARVGAALLVIGSACGACGDSDDNVSEEPEPVKVGISPEDVKLPSSIEDGALVNSWEVANPNDLDVPSPDVDGGQVVMYVDSNAPVGSGHPVNINVYEMAGPVVDLLEDEHPDSLVRENSICWNESEEESGEDYPSIQCHSPLDDGYIVTGFVDVPNSPVPFPADLDEALTRHDGYLDRSTS